MSAPHKQILQVTVWAFPSSSLEDSNTFLLPQPRNVTLGILEVYRPHGGGQFLPGCIWMCTTQGTSLIPEGHEGLSAGFAVVPWGFQVSSCSPTPHPGQFSIRMLHLLCFLTRFFSCPLPSCAQSCRGGKEREPWWLSRGEGGKAGSNKL